MRLQFASGHPVRRLLVVAAGVAVAISLLPASPAEAQVPLEPPLVAPAAGPPGTTISITFPCDGLATVVAVGAGSQVVATGAVTGPGPAQVRLFVPVTQEPGPITIQASCTSNYGYGGYGYGGYGYGGYGYGGGPVLLPQAIFFVLPAGFATADVVPGDVVTTDPAGVGPSPSAPIATEVTVPGGISGELAISAQPASTPLPPGFAILGTEVVISAPGAASTTDPWRFTFAIDASVIPPGHDETSIEVFKDGVPVPACTGPPGHAVPDPCVSSRVALDGGDVELGVLSSTASVWSFAVAETLPTPQFKNDCKSGGWQNLFDDQGRPFKNQGDCVSFVATGGKKKAKA